MTIDPNKLDAALSSSPSSVMPQASGIDPAKLDAALGQPDYAAQATNATLESVQHIPPDNAVSALDHGPSVGIPPISAMEDPTQARAQAQVQTAQRHAAQSPPLQRWSQGDPAKVAATQDDYGPLSNIAAQFGRDLFSPIASSAQAFWTGMQRNYATFKATQGKEGAGLGDIGKDLLNTGGVLLSPFAAIPNAAFVQPGARLLSNIPGAYGGGPSLSDINRPYVKLTKDEAKQEWEKSLGLSLFAMGPGKGKGGGGKPEPQFTGQEGPGPTPSPDGRFGVNPSGEVLHPSGEPMTFGSQKEAARWIIDEGHAKSPDQIFDISNGAKEGTFVVKQTGTAAAHTTPPGVDPAMDTVRAEVAKNDVSAIKLLTGQIAESKTFQRSPALMQEFLAQQNPDAVVYLDPNALAEVYKSNGWSPADPASPFAGVPEFQESWQTALATGQDLPMPLSEYLTSTAGHSAEDAVHEVARFREGGASLSELGTTTPDTSAMVDIEGKSASGGIQTRAAGEQLSKTVYIGGSPNVGGEFAASTPQSPIDLTVPAARTILPPEGAAEAEVTRIASIDKLVRDAVAQSKSRFLAQLFTDPKALGMNKKEFALYSTKVQSAFNSMHERLYAKVQSRVIKEHSDEFTTALAEHTAQATLDVRAGRGMHAAIALRYPHAEDNVLGGVKLADSVREAWGVTAKDFPKEYFSPDGFDEDTAAELMGFDSGQELMNALKEIEDLRGGVPFKEFLANVVKAEARARALEEVGDTMAPDLIERDIEEMFVAPEVGELLTDELKILAQRTGLPFDAGRLEAAARAQYLTMKVGPARNLRELQRGLMKSARRAELALLENKPLDAFRAKQEQLISHYILKDAFTFAKSFDRTLAQWRRWGKKSTMPSVAQEYLNYVHAQLMDMGLPVKRNVEELVGQLNGVTLSDFISSKLAEGAEIFQDTLYAKEVKAHSVGEFRGTADTLASLIHNGRLEKEIDNLGKKMAFDLWLAEFNTNMDALGRRLTPNRLRRDSIGGVTGRAARGLNAPMIRMEQLLDEGDGDNPLGPLNRAVTIPIQAAKNWENDRLQEVVKALGAFGKTQPKAWLGSMRKFVESPASLWYDGEPPIETRGQMVMAALNIGTEANARKFLEGYGWAEEDLADFLNTNMTKADWDFVQFVWDQYDKLWPDVERVYRKVAGVSPPKRVAREIVTPHGTYRGGYYGITYDKLRNLGPRKMAKDSIFGEEYHSALPANSYTKNLTNYLAPISLDFNTIMSRLMQTVHDLAYREALLQAHKVLSHPDVRKGIQQNFGPEYVGQLEPWVQYIARERVFNDASSDWAANLVRATRRNITAVGLGYRLSAIMKHGSSAMFDSAGEVGGKQILAAARDLYATPGQMEYYRDYVFSRSGEIRNRLLNADREIRENMLNLWKKQGGFLYDFQKFAYHGIALSDQFSAVPTWLAAERNAIAAGHSPSDAALIADKAVRKAHGASAPADLPSILRGGHGFLGEVGRTSMVFMGFLNHVYNRTWRIQRMVTGGVRKARGGDWAGARRDFSRAAALSFWYYIASGAVIGAIGAAQKDDKLGFHTLASGILHNSIGGVFGVKDMVDIAEGREPKGPFGQLMLDVAHAGKDDFAVLENLFGGHAKASNRALQNNLKTAGYLTGLPTGQVASTSQYLWDFSTGRERPRDIGQFLRGVAFGPKPKGKHK